MCTNQQTGQKQRGWLPQSPQRPWNGGASVWPAPPSASPPVASSRLSSASLHLGRERVEGVLVLEPAVAAVLAAKQEGAAWVGVARGEVEEVLFALAFCFG